MVKILLSFLLLFALNAFAQKANEKYLHGKVVADSATVEGINVINLVNEKSTITNSNGEFFIWAALDDLLVLTAVNLEIERKSIEKEDLESAVVIFKMIPKSISLKEVIVNEYANINAVSLGIISKDQKKYSPAERKLQTAGDFKPIHLLGLLGGSLAVDPILNAISGRTKMLKKELEVERKELLLLKLEAMFEDEYYTQKLEIPVHYIKGFQYYLVENADFVKFLKANDKQNTIIIIGELAVQFNQYIINGEK